MKRLSLLAIILMLSLLVAPTGAALAAPIAPGISISIQPETLIPAEAGFVHVGGGYPLDVTVTLDGEDVPIYWSGKGYVAFFTFTFEEEPGIHHIEVTAYNPQTGETAEKSQAITVTEFHYPEEYVALGIKLLPLLDPDMNIREEEHLNMIYSERSALLGWSYPFAFPAPAPIVTSRFGGSRSYNSGMWHSHHTGIDFRRGVGDPILAAASGRVATAELMDVRGNVVIIDHGYGVFTQYAHMSEFYVTPGQEVQQGQLIGLVGGTGRTNGPHLHFEVIVNGQPIDPLLWMRMAPGYWPPREVMPEEAQAEGEGAVPTEGGDTPPADNAAGS